MKLNDVNINIEDGGLGLIQPIGDGIHAKVGVCSMGEVNSIVTYAASAVDRIEDELGVGPLVDALYDSFATGASQIHVVRVESDIAASIGAVIATKTGQGSVTVTGTPLNNYFIVVEIVTDGAKNQAAFRYSLDDGKTFTRQFTVPTSLTFEIPNTGLTIGFTEFEAEPEESFIEGDSYRCRVKAPEASVEKVMAAVDVLLESQAHMYEFIHVVGASDSAVWSAMHTKALYAESKYRYMHFVCETRLPNEGETSIAWKNAMIAEKAGFYSTRVSVVASAGLIRDTPFPWLKPRNIAGVYTGRISAIRVRTSPGRVEDGRLMKIAGLYPEHLREDQIAELDEAGLVTIRQYIGLRGIYITNGRMAADVESDFRYVELRRTMDKACTEVRKRALQKMHAEIDVENIDRSMELLEAHLITPLDTMVADADISRGRVVIPRDQNVLGTSKIKAKIKIVPIGVLRELEIEIGFENPFQRGDSE